MTTDPTAYIDGNALAGPLSALFAIDITSATTTCVGCGQRSRVAELHVYAAGPGIVARCPGCQHSILRYVQTLQAGLLDLRGTVALTVPLQAIGGSA